jgi:hypothetical protein
MLYFENLATKNQAKYKNWLLLQTNSTFLVENGG